MSDNKIWRSLEKFECSEEAKLRVQVIIETTLGKRSVADACDALAMTEEEFCELREKVMQGMLRALESDLEGNGS